MTERKKERKIARAIEGGRKGEKGHGNMMRKRAAKRRWWRMRRRRKRWSLVGMRSNACSRAFSHRARTDVGTSASICERVPAQPTADALAERSCPPTSGSQSSLFPRFFFLPFPFPLPPSPPSPSRPLLRAAERAREFGTQRKSLCDDYTSCR